MAGAGYKLFNTGDVLTAAQVNTYLQEQVVMVFANAAARTTALSSVLAEGMVSYLKDTDALEIYSGSAWVGYGSGDITGVTAGTGISGGGTSGTVTITNSMATEITAAGDIIVGTGSGTFDNLPIGTTGQVLTADTTVSPYKVKWATAASGSNFAGCLIFKSGSNQTVNQGTSTAITMESEVFDSDGYHSTTTNTSRITIPSGKAGKYYVTGQVQLQDIGTNTMYMYIYKNGSQQKWSYYKGQSDNLTYQVVALVDCAVGDYLELFIQHNNSTSRLVFASSSTSQETSLSAYLVGA